MPLDYPFNDQPDLRPVISRYLPPDAIVDELGAAQLPYVPGRLPVFTEAAWSDPSPSPAQRIGLAFGDRPIPYHPTGQAGDFFAALLSSAANSYGTSALRADRERQGRNAYVAASDRQANDLNSRIDRQVLSDQEKRARLNLIAQQKAALEAQKDKAKAERDAARGVQGMDMLKMRLNAPRPVPAGGVIDPGSPSPWVEPLVNGDVEIGAVPSVRGNDQRTKAMNEIRARGLRLTPPKYKDAIANAASAVAILDKIGGYSKTINTSEGGVFDRVVTGLKSTGEGLTQKGHGVDVNQYNRDRNGVLALLARAVGHTGVLTQPDVESIKQMLPSVWTSGPSAERAINDAKELINRKVDAAKDAYTQSVYAQADPLSSKATISLPDADGVPRDVPVAEKDRFLKAVADEKAKRGKK